MVRVSVQAGAIAAFDADAWVVDHFKGGKLQPSAAAADAAAGGAIARCLAAGDFKGKLGEIAVLYPPNAPTPRILLVGLGEKAKLTLDGVRRAAAKATRRAKDLGLAKVAFAPLGAGVARIDAADGGRAVAEGVVLAAYEFKLYKSGKDKDPDEPDRALEEAVVVEPDRRRADSMRKGVAVGTVVAESVNVTRDIATVSGREAHPVAIAKRVAAMAKETGLKIQVLGRKECEKEGMGAFLGVNQGSAQEPAFVVLEHTPKRKSAPTVVVIGKGITFDTGGISIKPAGDMDHMRFDKCGAAAVFGILRAAALLDLPVHVVGLTPLTDNMPGGNAYKPGDILTAANGKTIEVLNTDAEGRLVLADALAYADRFKPDAVLDLATLTGAASIALGTQAIAIMGTDSRLLRRIEAAAEATHERVWELPFWEEYDEQIASKVADVKNIGGRNAGTIIGGRFLAKFAGDWPWAHLDIASTAWNDSKPEFNGDYSPTMATGVGVRLVVEMLKDWKPLAAKRP